MMNTYSVQKGSSLIEVMIALFVMAIGLLGVLSLQANSIQVTKTASYYSQATILAHDMAESMLLTQGAAEADETFDEVGLYYLGYDDATPSDPGCILSACTPEQLVQWSLYKWRTNIQNALPGGEAEIAPDAETDSGAIISIRFHVGYDPVTGDPITDSISIKNTVETF